MATSNIRNFSIIAHIDHGKSTLADRMLEITGALEAREMREQVLDKMELERERGITIKMTPARMSYTTNSESYTLNLIDTPGHVDFSYEVSRSLKAVEGVILLVDATQGIEAQTLSVLGMAREENLVIIPVVSKIDSLNARVEETKEMLANLLNCSSREVLGVSGKTGAGVKELLEEIVARIPPPEIPRGTPLQALVFDFSYSTHRGIVAYVRVFSGAARKGDDVLLQATKERFSIQEVGVFTPHAREVETLLGGEIGYLATGIKEPGRAIIGDTVVLFRSPAPALSGYRKVKPVVWASVFPENQDDFLLLKRSLKQLKLSDSSLSFEEESSLSLGRGFRCGFLGVLHLEIIIERLRREFNLSLVVTFPSVVYKVRYKNGKQEIIYSPTQFPDDGTYEEALEPWVEVRLITSSDTLGSILQILHTHEALVGASTAFDGERIEMKAELPLREFMRGLFDELKRTSSGYASISYEIIGDKPANVSRLDVLVSEDAVPAFSQVVSRARIYEAAKQSVERLYEILPRQMFPVKIQGSAHGRILSSKTLPALKKDVTGHLYGGDITRKRKLWKKQKKGKKKLKERGKVNIPHEVFLKMIRQR